MVAKNSNKKRKIKRIIWTIFIIYTIFFIYSNLDLSKKREIIYYSNLTIKNETIEYNSEIITGAEPIFIDKGKEKAILLLHGMGGTPIELKELGEYLANQNITVLIPLLDHQGRSFEDLRKVTQEKLYNESLNYLNILKKNYQKVYVGGLSTGGSLTLKIAENENVSGIISIATPITYGFNFLGDSTRYLFEFLKFITPNVRRVPYGLAKNPEVPKILPSFDRLPVSILIQGEILKKDVKENLGKINEPILILQSNFDNRASPSSADYIFEHVNFYNKTIIYLNNSGHVITMDYDKEIVFEKIKEFILAN